MKIDEKISLLKKIIQEIKNISENLDNDNNEFFDEFIVPTWSIKGLQKKIFFLIISFIKNVYIKFIYYN